MKVIYLGVGTFWLTEAVYKQVIGVTEVLPGYMGGDSINPSFETVATGTTGHVEVVKIVYDETVVTTETLLEIFYTIHDPSVAEHPTHGIGSQYRPVIFYTDEREGEATSDQNGVGVGIISQMVERIQASLPAGQTVSTHVVSAREFYPAEGYHYEYFQRNPDAAFSVEVIKPKLELVRQRFPERFR